MQFTFSNLFQYFYGFRNSLRSCRMCLTFYFIICVSFWKLDHKFAFIINKLNVLHNFFFTIYLTKVHFYKKIHKYWGGDKNYPQFMPCFNRVIFANFCLHQIFTYFLKKWTSWTFFGHFVNPIPDLWPHGLIKSILDLLIYFRFV